MEKLSFYTPKELKPKGIMRRQLEIQAAGLSGNLDKVWRDVKESKWLGGNCDGWERLPYFLDGFVPLAYLLEDEDMIARAKKYVNAILEKQESDGWICPCKREERKNYDTWALQLISKVLTVYYECSGDERIPDVIYRLLKNYYDLLESGEIVLFNWGKCRWFETFIALNFLAERYHDAWIKKLAVILDKEGFDYREMTHFWEKPLNLWRYETHVVNMAMMLKTEAVTDTLLDGKYRGSSKKLYDCLMKYNGTPVGIFTGDECLSGISPIQGTELCAVAELMYSCEHLYASTGDSEWGKVLERVAFNAMPATVSDDMWGHQYVQMTNQISCERFPGRSLFRTNGSEAHLFGLEPEYGCCTANFHQAFPKFALSSFMHSKNCVVSLSPVPSKLDADGISLELESDYPFTGRLTYIIDPGKAFTLKVRIPEGAQNIRANENYDIFEDCLVFTVPADISRRIEISFDRTPTFDVTPVGLTTVRYGALVFSLPVKIEKKMHEYERNGVVRKFPYCDYEYVGSSEWRYAYLDRPLEIVEDPDALRLDFAVPFSGDRPPLKIKASVVPINWDFEDGFNTVAAKLPSDLSPTGEQTTVTLIPYGCAKLRLTELPVAKGSAFGIRKEAF